MPARRSRVRWRASGSHGPAPRGGVGGYGSLADAETRTAFVHTLRSVVDVGGQRGERKRSALPHGQMPTLIMWGDHDRIIPVAQGHATHAAMPGSRLEIFEGAGHFPHCEDPERFSNVLVDFMRTTQPSRRLRRSGAIACSPGAVSAMKVLMMMWSETDASGGNQADIDAAIEWARRLPARGTVAVRPLIEYEPG